MGKGWGAGVLGGWGWILKQLHALCSLNQGLIIISFTSVSLSKQDKISCVVATYL